MIHIYKSGGDWNRDGIDYTVKVVSFHDLEDFLDDGWVRSFEELPKSKPRKKAVNNDDTN